MSSRVEAGARRNPWHMAQDVTLSLVLAVLGIVEAWLPLESAHGAGSPLTSTVGILLAAVALSARRSHPWTAIGVFVVWLALGILTLGQLQLLFFGQIVPFMIALYSAARHGRGRVPAAAGAAAGIMLLFGDVFIPLLQPWNEIVFHWSVCALAFATGWGLRRAEERVVRAAVEARDAVRDSGERTAAAVTAERTRIARELHDVLAHSVSVMIVQAGAAEQVMAADPARSRRALQVIRDTGNQSLEEVRRLVTLLREDDVAELSPQPGLAAIDDLIAGVRAPGFDATFTVDGDTGSVPPAMGLTVYRIVQESLTNTRRHSDASGAAVSVVVDDDGIRIEIVDDGAPRVMTGPAGHGILGMRERVALYGGTLEASPGDSGFRVTATLKRAAT